MCISPEKEKKDQMTEDSREKTAAFYFTKHLEKQSRRVLERIELESSVTKSILLNRPSQPSEYVRWQALLNGEGVGDIWFAAEPEEIYIVTENQ